MWPSAVLIAAMITITLHSGFKLLSVIASRCPASLPRSLAQQPRLILKSFIYQELLSLMAWIRSRHHTPQNIKIGRNFMKCAGIINIILLAESREAFYDNKSTSHSRSMKNLLWRCWFPLNRENIPGRPGARFARWRQFLPVIYLWKGCANFPWQPLAHAILNSNILLFQRATSKSVTAWNFD